MPLDVARKGTLDVKDPPLKAIVAANDNYEGGYHKGNAGGLDAVDPDLAPANIKLAETIFGKVGTLAPGTLAEDILGSGQPIDTATMTGGAAVAMPAIAGGGDYACATKTQAYDASSMAVAVGFANTKSSGADSLKLRLYMDGVQVAESAYIVSGNAADMVILVATRALSGAKICKVDIHNYSGTSKNATLPSACDVTGDVLATGIGIGSIKLV